MPTMDTSRPSRNSTPQSTAMSPQIDASHFGVEVGVRWVMGRRYMQLQMLRLQKMRSQNLRTPVRFRFVPATRTKKKDEALVDAWRGLLDSHARAHGAL